MAKQKSLSFATREEWLAARKGLLTASDSRAILGQGFANESPLSVWESKVSDEVENRTSIALQIGLLMEEPVTDVIKLVTGIKPSRDRSFRIRVHKEHEWMGATLDAWDRVDGVYIPYEFKWIGSYKRDEWVDDQVPLKVQIQVQHQIAVCDAPFAYVCAMSGGLTEPFIRRVNRDDEFIDALIRHLSNFRRYIRDKTPPPVDDTIATADAIYRMHPDDNGKAVDLPAEADEWVVALEKTKALIKEYQAVKREAENRLKLCIGDNTAGLLPDGSCVTWKTQERAEHVVKASTFRVLRMSKSLPKGIHYEPESSVGIDGEPEVGEVAGQGLGIEQADNGEPGRVDGGGSVPSVPGSGTD